MDEFEKLIREWVKKNPPIIVTKEVLIKYGLTNNDNNGKLKKN